MRGDDDEIMNLPVMAKDPNRERVLRRAR